MKPECNLLAGVAFFAGLRADENREKVQEIGATTSALLDALRGVLNPVFALLDGILAPVLSLLGIQIGIADVTVFSLTCGAPQQVR
ncbi:MAG: hypothetical protein WAV95_12540 [Azonexus sp.]